jgi:hypothetical protein
MRSSCFFFLLVQKHLPHSKEREGNTVYKRDEDNSRVGHTLRYSKKVDDDGKRREDKYRRRREKERKNTMTTRRVYTS